MWYHTLLNSEEERYARKVLKRQMKEENNWYTEIQQDAKTNNINIEENHVTNVSYDVYKNNVKQKIRAKLDDELMDGKRLKTKLRWINPGESQCYLKGSSISEASKMMKVRLHMARIKGNFGGGTCRKCGIEEETTEHVLQCLTDGILPTTEEWTSNVGWLRKATRILATFDDE